jgi:spore germination protein KA
MVNPEIINGFVVDPLSKSRSFEGCSTLSQAYQLCAGGVIGIADIKETDCTRDAVEGMLAGNTLALFDKLKSGLILNTIGFDKRAITAGTEESTYRSGKDVFVETFRTNTATLRKKIKSPNLCIEEMVAGKQSHTRIGLAYMRNICDDEFVDKVRKRIQAIDLDRIINIKDLGHCIVSERYTPFPVFVTTEKADSCCISLLEGKVAVLADEIPYAIVLPGVFGDIFQSPSDYGLNFMASTFFRLIQYICFVISVIAPGFFISITTYHPDMIPYRLSLSIAGSRMGTPFSVSVETIVMSLAFFALIQASLQISRTIGGTVSIVGGLILGEAAIQAGLVSPAVIVVVAVASITSLAIPNKEGNGAIWLFQALCTLFSMVLGLLGVALSLLIMLFILAKLEPLGVPYLSPYFATEKIHLEDSFLRYPQSMSKWRPSYLHPKNRRRIGR